MRLDINRKVRIDRRLPETQGFWTKYEPPKEEKKSQDKEVIYVKEVEGESKAGVGDKVKYRVTQYTQKGISEEEKKDIKWTVSVEGKRTNLTDKGEVITLPIKTEWAGKEIIVMPYLHSSTEKVSVKTKVKGCSYVDTTKIAEYICTEIKNNYKSSTAIKIKKYNDDFKQGFWSYAGITLNVSSALARMIDDKIEAYLLWKNIVGGGKDWDHKTDIRDLLGYKIDKPKKEKEWSCDKNKDNPLLFNFDIWSNIHYGFIGKYVGFTEWELLQGAGFAQIFDHNDTHLNKWETWKNYFNNRLDKIGDADILAAFDDPMDNEAIKIGFRLYDRFKNNPELLTSTIIMNELYTSYHNQKPIHIELCEKH